MKSGRNEARSRKPISKFVQLRVFQRDRWICRWCGRPVIFAPTMKYLEQFVRYHGHIGQLAYYHRNWARGKAPLLDHMGAVIDHHEAHSGGGADDEPNLLTSCNKCNTRKSNTSAVAFSKRSPLLAVKGKYGEPEHWDGLSRLFVLLVEQYPQNITTDERSWLEALRGSK